MRRWLAVFSAWLLLSSPGLARLDPTFCGTYRDRWKVDMHLHKRAELARRKVRAQSAGAQAAPARAVTRDLGNIVIMDDSDGVVGRLNPFDLDQQTLRFTPAAPGATSYTFQVSGPSFDDTAAASTTVVSLGDDDSHMIALPFSFPFFGASYQNVFINSDGNITLGASDAGHNDRSLGRVVSGPPRVAPLFEDLDPSLTPQGITVRVDATHLVVSWVSIQEYSTGIPETFQARLFPDGRIEFAYNGIFTTGAIVGISPGGLQGSANVVSFTGDTSATYSSTVVERFTFTDEVDVQTAAQKFYETHEDAYDYLVFFNNLGVQASEGAVAFEETVRNVNRSGYGDFPIDIGKEYGSPARLQAVLNMGSLDQFPKNPTDIATVRLPSPYTGLAMLAHEAGHLFLAFASVKDPLNPDGFPMLGIQNAHWAYNFNAEASFMEGNRIKDNGAAASPRFTTTDAVDNYSLLDQYLMGFRAAEELPPTFLSTGHPAFFSLQFPRIGATFNGGRRDIAVDELIQAIGRRTPDYTVAQRRFRFAFVLIAHEGTEPTQAQLDQLEAYRSQFEGYFATASSNRGIADTTLKHALLFSISPAAGVIQGSSGTATLTIQTVLNTPLSVGLVADSANVTVPDSVVIPAGASTVSFQVMGQHSGIAQITATAADSTFETAVAKVQVSAATGVQLALVSGNKQVTVAGAALANPVVVHVSDINNLAYPGASVQATPSADGSVVPTAATTDAGGNASFQWTPGTGSARTLQIAIAGAAANSGVTALALAPGSANPLAVSSAAFSQPGLSPGALASIFGTNLAGGATATAPFPWPQSLSGVSVAVNGKPGRVLFVRDDQINFLVPPDVQPGPGTVTVTTPVGTSAPIGTLVNFVSPGIFVIGGGYGAILNSGTAQTTAAVPAHRGEYVEIYCTGLGPTAPSSTKGLFETVDFPQVFIGGQEATVAFSGLAAAYQMGLYQVNVQVPADLPAGVHSLLISIDGLVSNSVLIGVQ